MTSTLSRNMKLRRADKGMTLAELSEATGISLSHLSGIERGRTTTTDKLTAIAEGLGLSLGQLVDPDLYRVPSPEAEAS